MNNITLYGHLTMDTVFNGVISYKSVGAIGNVWQMLSKLSPNYQINIEPTRIGEALILVNKKKAERSSIANLNLQKESRILPPPVGLIFYILMSLRIYLLWKKLVKQGV